MTHCPFSQNSMHANAKRWGPYPRHLSSFVGPPPGPRHGDAAVSMGAVAAVGGAVASAAGELYDGLKLRRKLLVASCSAGFRRGAGLRTPCRHSLISRSEILGATSMIGMLRLKASRSTASMALKASAHSEPRLMGVCALHCGGGDTGGGGDKLLALDCLRDVGPRPKRARSTRRCPLTPPRWRPSSVASFGLPIAKVLIEMQAAPFAAQDQVERLEALFVSIPDPDDGDPVLPNDAFHESLRNQCRSGGWG